MCLKDSIFNELRNDFGCSEHLPSFKDVCLIRDDGRDTSNIFGRKIPILLKIKSLRNNAVCVRVFVCLSTRDNISFLARIEIYLEKKNSIFTFNKIKNLKYFISQRLQIK